MSVKTYRVSREGETLLSPHFRVREFACHDGSDTVKIDEALVELLEQIRATAGGAVTINSGYRTTAYNAQGDLMLSQPVTRQQLLVILHRFAQLEGRRWPPLRQKTKDFPKAAPPDLRGRADCR